MNNKQLQERFSDGFNKTIHKLFIEDHQSREEDGQAIKFYSLFPKDRYFFDFNMNLNEWMQFDTDQDAHYFGNWINPSLLATFSYCEGDTYLNIYEDSESFKRGVESIIEFYNRDGSFQRIDQGLNPCEANMAFMNSLIG